MAQWDLTTTIGEFLDRHLVFPLLEFLTNNQIYDGSELLKARLDLATNTMMLDYAMDLWTELYKDENPPQELIDRKAEVLEILKEHTVETEYIRKVFEEIFKENTSLAQLESARDGKVLLDMLVKSCDFKIECMDAVFHFAKNQYECGNYSCCAEYLYLCQLLLPPTDKNYLNFLWGRLATGILNQQWDVALDDFNRLKEFIDNNNFSGSSSSATSLNVLQQRTWLIHWSLFIFFNHVKGQDLIIDMFLFQPQYLNAIQTTCPHILRYLTAAVITNKQRPSVMKELVKVIQQESYAYRDPITEFVECLYVNFDFDGAQKKLRECEEVLKSDFFLISCLDVFMENARLVIFETFCCIHQCISIEMLAEKLNMTPEKAEKWIVNLIRNARLDAKIDSRLGHVVMGINALSPYQQLIEKTKLLSFRAQVMVTNLEKKMTSNLPERQIPYWPATEF